MLKCGSFYGALFAVLFSVMLVGCGGGNKPQGSSNQTSQTSQSAQSKPQTDKAATFAEINKILDLESVKKEKDHVERKTIYRPFTEFGVYPSWQVTQDGDTVKMDAVIMDGTPWDKSKKNSNFIYWTTLIFSTDEKKWEYTIPHCSGSTGGGKETSSNQQGTYEYFKTPFVTLVPGYRLLVEGTNPKIRLKGVNKRKDIKVSSEMIAALKNGLRLDELFQSTRGKIERTQ